MGELVGSRIEDVIAKARLNQDWSIDTSAEKHVDFFGQHDYPFRVELDVDGVITEVSRPKVLMDRYDAIVEDRYGRDGHWAGPYPSPSASGWRARWRRWFGGE